jgi:hypothetical protein
MTADMPGDESFSFSSKVLFMLPIGKFIPLGARVARFDMFLHVVPPRWRLKVGR